MFQTGETLEIKHLRTVIQINIIYFCLQKRDTGSGPLYPIMGFGQIGNMSMGYFNLAPHQ